MFHDSTATMVRNICPFERPFFQWTCVIQYQNASILDFIGSKDDGGGGNNWSYKTCQAPVKSSPPTNQPQLFRPDALPVAQPTELGTLFTHILAGQL